MKYNNSKFLLIGLVVLSLLICLGSISAATNDTNTDTNTQNINMDDNDIQDNYEIEQQTTKKSTKR